MLLAAPGLERVWMASVVGCKLQVQGWAVIICFKIRLVAYQTYLGIQLCLYLVRGQRRIKWTYSGFLRWIRSDCLIHPYYVIGSRDENRDV